jgi:hypothetical protein
MVLMAIMGVLLVVGIVLTLRWSDTAYETWEPEAGGPAKAATLRYLRGVAIALVGGFWAGALVTGPGVRLIMRLLAVTAGDDAQGRITEAEEVVGKINVDGTIGLYLFGGVLPGLLSGAIYLLIRRWLPGGRLGGVVFGILHLVVAATRIDPLRPENPDFDIVGPGWLSVATFALTAILHGMAVVAIGNRYSQAFPPELTAPAERARAVGPLVLPVLLLVPGVSLLVVILLGLVVAVVASQIPPLVRTLRSRAVVVAGRVALASLALVLLPGTVTDLRDVIVRDGSGQEAGLADSPPGPAPAMASGPSGPAAPSPPRGPGAAG